MLLPRIAALWKWLRRRSRVESEMDTEMRFHIEAYAADLERAGMSRAAAARQARMEFGGIDGTKEDCRQSLGLRLIDELRQDLEYAVRSLRASPRFAATAVLSLALGIGANTVVFSYVSAVLLQPFDYRKPEELVRIQHETDRQISWPLQQLLDLRARSRVFRDIAAEYIFPIDRNLLSDSMDHAERIRCSMVTHNYFDVLGVRPAIGRGFLRDEEGAVMLSNAFWREILGADRSVIGKPVMLDGKPHRVIGVLPAGSFDRRHVMGWLPVSFAPDRLQEENWMVVIARLHAGVPLAAAQQELRGFEAKAMTLRGEFARWGSPKFFLLLWGTVTFVLLIACANLANLMLARAVARQREVTIRLSIGAGRFRLIRQFLTESLVLAMCGGGLGLLVAWLVLPLAASLTPPRLIAPETAVVLDWRVLFFSLAAAVSTGLLFGLAPALQFSKPPSRPHAGEPRGNALRKVLLATQTALAFVLATGAGVMIHSLARTLAVDIGVRAENVVTWSVDLRGSGYGSPAPIRRYQEDVLRRVGGMRSVQSVSIANATPFGEGLFGAKVSIEGYPDARSGGMVWQVTPEYRETLGIRLLAGRWLEASDRRGSDPVAVVGRAFVDNFLDGASPIGLRIRPFYKGDAVTVVGLVETTLHRGRMVSVEGEVYVPLAQVPDNQIRSAWSFLVRTRDEPSIVMPAIRDLAASVDRTVAVPRLETIEQLLSRDVDLPRVRTVLFASFGGLALLLAGLGVYGVAHYGAVQRTQEIGIRMALGARNRHVILLVVRQSMTAVLAGLAIGFAGALVLTRLLTKLLFEVTPHDPVTFAAIVVVVLAVTLAASYLPARRATAIDPVTALRYQ